MRHNNDNDSLSVNAETKAAGSVDCTGLVDDALLLEYADAQSAEKKEWEHFDRLTYANHDKIAKLRSEVDDAREQWGIAYSRMKQLARQIEKASTVELSQRANNRNSETKTQSARVAARPD